MVVGFERHQDKIDEAEETRRMLKLGDEVRRQAAGISTTFVPWILSTRVGGGGGGLGFEFCCNRWPNSGSRPLVNELPLCKLTL